MSQSLTRVYLHIVFSTRDRQPFLRDPILRSKTHAYLVGVCQNQNSPSLIVGGVDDQIHILCRQSKNISVADLVRELKRDSSKWMKSQGTDLKSFYWQEGYGAFSLSPGHVEAVKHYIANQEDHHRKVNFQDEFRKLCKKYGLELDERYAWD